MNIGGLVTRLARGYNRGSPGAIVYGGCKFTWILTYIVISSGDIGDRGSHPRIGLLNFQPTYLPSRPYLEPSSRFYFSIGYL